MTRKDEEIDKIVDTLIKDEQTAEALKAKLHQSFDEPPAQFVKAAEAGEDDDLWDNMPV